MNVSAREARGLADARATLEPDIRRLHPASLGAEGLDTWLKQGLIQELPDVRLDTLLKVRPDLFTSLDHLVLAVNLTDGLPRAVLGSKWAGTAAGTRFLHIAVMFVSQRLRGRDLFARTWLALLDEVINSGGFPRVSVLKTYNPVAFCAMRAYGLLPGTTMYPSLRGEQNGALCRLALEVADVLAPGSEFEPDTGCIRGIGVPRDLYRGRPESNDSEVNAYFERHAHPGDRILCIVQVESPAVEEAIVNGFRGRGADRSPHRR